MARPLSRPTRTSLNMTTNQWRMVISRRARPRMVTARAWAPALPDWPATTGSRMASAVTWAMVFSNRPTTAAARKAVSRLTCSQGMRFFTANRGLDRARSSRLTPTMVWISAELSSCTACTRALLMITPSSTPSISTTGRSSST